LTYPQLPFIIGKSLTRPSLENKLTEGKSLLKLQVDNANVLRKESDEEVVKLAKTGDETATEYIINKYKNFVRVKAKSYFLVGADREDIIQEGMIGLFKAIRDFKADKLSSFRAFAELCITRQIITAIKTATRQKHIPLNSYISLNKPVYDEDSDRTMLDIVSGAKIMDPEQVFIDHELSDDLRDKIKQNLSELESQVLVAYLEGESYQEMAKKLSRHVKSIDNALQRVKRKIEKTLAETNSQYN
jgi:RNA polymerase sporulation-specific sigma factor